MRQTFGYLQPGKRGRCQLKGRAFGSSSGRLVFKKFIVVSFMMLELSTGISRGKGLVLNFVNIFSFCSFLIKK